MRKRHPYSLADLQAFADGEGSEPQRAELINHVTHCSRCRKKLDDVIQTTRFIEERLASSLSKQRSPVSLVDRRSLSADGPENLDAAWQRFLARVSETPISPRWNSLTNSKEAGADREIESRAAIQPLFENRQSIPAVTEHPATEAGRVARLRIRRTVALRTLAAAAGTVFLIGAFTTDIGNRALAAMLHTFRMEHLVGVGEDNLADISRAMAQAGAGTIDLRQYGKIEHRGGGSSRESTVIEALQSVGYPVRALPGSDPV
ncbi:MAG: zf-HC2 domain-containing protein, partial [Alicyclobacillaceae bacterium]|nr:zf-HC2 domain-containing protein [Alicyclobacillaceae bacterium]